MLLCQTMLPVLGAREETNSSNDAAKPARWPDHTTVCISTRGWARPRSTAARDAWNLSGA
jgi:hypothetical protein